ncbi:MAG: flagellar motor protein [Gammaproteobacteria bacterium]|nr:flagellar motor protein [Gammaproteobacteria bacterium]PCH62721.1 MAG: flagellar motor protein [Gammaproteobacteria bacterium]PCH64166.1 MAG: flagellar motor protein [Gammaproteobacteria bacterium]
MDFLSLLGITVALVAILGGNILEGGHTSSLVQATAFVIVIGGTVGAIMLQVPVRVFARSLYIVRWVFIPPKVNFEEYIGKIVNWSNVARREGLLGLEVIVEDEQEDFARKGLQLLVDGSEPESIRAILDVDIMVKEDFDLQASKVYEGMGGYAPTVGILGAVMGLIHVMNNLADPSKLGPGIAVAFVATIYGVGFANLFFLPIAAKLKSSIHHQSRLREMVLEGIVAIAEGENPRNIETKLQGYLI